AEPGVAKSVPTAAQAEPAKQRMPWETQPGVAKATTVATKSEPSKARMPWETEAGVAKAGSLPKAQPVKQRMPWEAAPSTQPAPAGAAGGGGTATSKATAAAAPGAASGKWVLLPDARAADNLLATGAAIDSRPVNGLPAPAGSAGGSFVRQVQAKGSNDPKVLRFEDLDWDGSGTISKEDLMNVLLAYQTQQVTIEMPNVQTEVAKAKAHGAQIWGEGAGPAVLSKGKAKAKGKGKGKGKNKGPFKGKGKGPPPPVAAPVVAEKPEPKKPAGSQHVFGTCVHCYKTLTDDSTFCRHCGMRRVRAAMEWDASGDEAPAEVEAPAVELPPAPMPVPVPAGPGPSPAVHRPPPPKAPVKAVPAKDGPPPPPPLPKPPASLEPAPEPKEEVQVPWRLDKAARVGAKVKSWVRPKPKPKEKPPPKTPAAGPPPKPLNLALMGPEDVDLEMDVT
ncbi:unnamed protein product, partial [Symbiodinium sp. CCMP2456]